MSYSRTSASTHWDPNPAFPPSSQTIKKAECQRIDAFELLFEDSFESPLNSKEIKPVNPKGN